MRVMIVRRCGDSAPVEVLERREDTENADKSLIRKHFPGAESISTDRHEFEFEGDWYYFDTLAVRS